MKRIELNENLAISAIVQGFWRLDGWGFSDTELADFMNQCIDRGITTFDTAEIYGGTVCETLMGQAFKKDSTIRKRVELVSKTGIFQTKVDGEGFGYYDTTYDRVMQSCKESLKRLETDSLDLYLIHREDPLFDPWETARALKDLKKQGLVREVGVSNFDPFKFNALNKAMDGTLVTNQIEWNPMCFEHFDSGMIDLLSQEKIHPMIWSPLAGGRLFSSNVISTKAMAVLSKLADKYSVDPATIVYAWILYHPVGAAPIIGSNKMARIDCAIKALDVKLSHSEWYEIFVASGQKVLR